MDQSKTSHDDGDHAVVHTPGPWIVKRRFDVYADTGQPGIGGTYIGTTRGNGELPEGVARRCEADARLIAAAPELLECLRDVMACGIRKLDNRIGYDELQIDRETQKQAADLISRFE